MSLFACCFSPGSLDLSPEDDSRSTGRDAANGAGEPIFGDLAKVPDLRLPMQKTKEPISQAADQITGNPVAVSCAPLPMAITTATDMLSDGAFRALNAAESNAVQGALLKVSALIQQFAEGRTERTTPIQLLRRAVGLVTADCRAAYGTMHLLPEAQDCALLVAAVGVPDGLVLHESSRLPQLSGSASSLEMLLASGLDYISWSRSGTQPLPTDWAALVLAVGLHWIAAVPVRVNGLVLGVLTVGFQESVDQQAESAVWPTYLKLVAASLSSMVRDGAMPKYLTLVQDVHASRDLDGALQRVMLNLRSILGGQHSWYRLALTSSNSTQAVMFDDLSQVPTALAPRGHSSGQFASAGSTSINGIANGCSNGHNGNGTSSPAGSGHSSTGGLRMGSAVAINDYASTGVLRSVVLLKNAIMKITVNNRQQVIIPDVQKLINQSGSVATDLFSTRLLKPPTSVLVFPLKVRAHIFGVVYCMSAVHTDFADVAPRLREVSDLLAPHLLVMLATDLGPEYRLDGCCSAPGLCLRLPPRWISGVKAPLALDSLTAGLQHTPPLTANLSRANSQPSMGQHPERENSSPGSSEAFLADVRSSSSENFFSQYQRSPTGALVTGITEKLNQKRIKSAMDVSLNTNLGDLCVTELLGEGGFAKVFMGTWRGLPVGIKVVVCSEDENSGALMKNAHEIAILSALSHPNLIQAYACITDVHVADFVTHCLHSASPELATSPAFTYLQVMDNRMCHIEVIEYCDMGNLADALKSGVFVAAAPGAIPGAGGRAAMVRSASPGRSAAMHVNMRTLLLTLIEIASAVSHLHRMGVVHCDLKVSDFGLSRVQDDDTCASFPFNSCGTAAYVAPEALIANKRVDASVDVYAYGIVMWELYTRQKPYGSMKQQLLVREVVTRGLRPVFPTRTPAPYVALAQACWAGLKDERPSFDEILTLLHGMLQAHIEATGGMRRTSSTNGTYGVPAFRAEPIRPGSPALMPTGRSSGNNNRLYGASGQLQAAHPAAVAAALSRQGGPQGSQMAHPSQQGRLSQ